MSDEASRALDFLTFLGHTLPSTFELILFDVTRRDLPVAACVNRRTGTHKSARSLVRELLADRALREKGHILNRANEDEQGKLIRASAYLFRDASGAPTEALCVLMRCDIYLGLEELASSVLRFSTEDPEGGRSESREHPRVSSEPSLDVIGQVVAEAGVEPGRATPAERVDLICDLYDMGVFEIRGAIARTAEALQVSEPSIYRYLSKIKKART